MKKMVAGAFVTLLLSFLSTRNAQSQAAANDVPTIVQVGFDSLKTGGFEAAVRTWMKGSPVEDPASPGQMAATLGPVLGKYRAYAGYDVLGIVPIGDHVRRVYAAMLFERGPIYAWFDCYRTPAAWIISAFLVNPQPQSILPAEMLRPVAATR